MVSYKGTLDSIVKLLQENADYLQVPIKNIHRNRTIIKSPFIAVLAQDVSRYDAINKVGILPTVLVCSVESEKDITRTQDKILDLQARIFNVLEQIDYIWSDSVFEETNIEGVTLDNPLLAINIELYFNPLMESINE